MEKQVFDVRKGEIAIRAAALLLLSLVTLGLPTYRLMFAGLIIFDSKWYGVEESLPILIPLYMIGTGAMVACVISVLHARHSRVEIEGNEVRQFDAFNRLKFQGSMQDLRSVESEVTSKGDTLKADFGNGSMVVLDTANRFPCLEKLLRQSCSRDQPAG